MRLISKLIATIACVGFTTAALATERVPEFGTKTTRNLKIVGTEADKLKNPRDLAFNPDEPTTLWVVNRSTDSTSIFKNVDTDKQTLDWRQDKYANHFMEEVSAIAFGDRTYKNTMTFGTCHESRNTYNGRSSGNDFMGPTLWPADLEVYARANQNNRLLGSHIDMVHQSPLCMGMAHQKENVYWVNDGLAGHLVYYDFVQDHGTGRDDHSDAIVRRYPEVELSRVENVPGHMVFDEAKVFLYIADVGNSRILKVDTRTGEYDSRLRARNEPLDEFSKYLGVEFEVFASTNLEKPSGLTISNGRLFATDYATGAIIAYDLGTGDELERIMTNGKGIMGITTDASGDLWYVNGGQNTVTRVER
jgi:hypothetical protein